MEEDDAAVIGAVSIESAEEIKIEIKLEEELFWPQ
jgi:hypothetical protein